MLPLTEWRLQHCSLRGIRAIRLVVASSNSLLSPDSLETGTGSSNSLPSANESLRTDALVVAFGAAVISSTSGVLIAWGGNSGASSEQRSVRL